MSVAMALRIANRDDLTLRQTALLCAAEEYGGYKRVMLVDDAPISLDSTLFDNCVMPVEPLVIKIGRCDGYSMYDQPQRLFNDTSKRGARRGQRNQNKVWRR